MNLLVDLYLRINVLVPLKIFSILLYQSTISSKSKDVRAQVGSFSHSWPDTHRTQANLQWLLPPEMYNLELYLCHRVVTTNNIYRILRINLSAARYFLPSALSFSAEKLFSKTIRDFFFLIFVLFLFSGQVVFPLFAVHCKSKDAIPFHQQFVNGQNKVQVFLPFNIS